MSGAVDLLECPRANKRLTCRCSPCAACGYGKHAAVHAPHLGEPPGSEPWDHEYVSPESVSRFSLELTVRTSLGHTTHTVELESLADLEELGAEVRATIDAWIARAGESHPPTDDSHETLRKAMTNIADGCTDPERVARVALCGRFEAGRATASDEYLDALAHAVGRAPLDVLAEIAREEMSLAERLGGRCPYCGSDVLDVDARTGLMCLSCRAAIGEDDEKVREALRVREDGQP